MRRPQIIEMSNFHRIDHRTMSSIPEEESNIDRPTQSQQHQPQQLKLQPVPEEHSPQPSEPVVFGIARRPTSCLGADAGAIQNHNELQRQSITPIHLQAALHRNGMEDYDDDEDDDEDAYLALFSTDTFRNSSQETEATEAAVEVHIESK